MRIAYEEPKKAKTLLGKIWQHWTTACFLKSLLAATYIWVAANEFWVAVIGGAVLLAINEF